MKKLVVVLSLFCMMVILAGCKYEIIYDFTQGNGVRVTSAVYYSEDEINTAKMTEEELKQFEVVTLDDGKTYYKNSETQIKSIDEISKDTSLGIIKANLIYIPLNMVEEKEKENSNATGDGIEDLENSIDYDFSFILTEDIVETNGTHTLPAAVDWVTWSPKDLFDKNVPTRSLKRIDEIKVVFDGEHNPECYSSISSNAYLSLQPCDTGDDDRNQQIVSQCVDYILSHPHWHLSLQTHKLINIP